MNRYFYGVDKAAPRILFCFHHAGGGTALFRGWQHRLSPAIDVVPVLLPGRERRVREARFQTLDALLDDLGKHLEPYAGRPHAFFGHSMGALIAYGLTLRRQQAERPLPQALFVSACPAPQRQSQLDAAGLDADALIGILTRIGGTPVELLARADWRELALPIFRDDLLVCSNYSLPTDVLLRCPLYVFGGSRDPRVSAAELHAWTACSAAPVPVTLLPGEHFYLRDASADLLRHLHSALTGRPEQPAIRPRPAFAIDDDCEDLHHPLRRVRS